MKTVAQRIVELEGIVSNSALSESVRQAAQKQLDVLTNTKPAVQSDGFLSIEEVDSILDASIAAHEKLTKPYEEQIKAFIKTRLEIWDWSFYYAQPQGSAPVTSDAVEPKAREIRAEWEKHGSDIEEIAELLKRLTEQRAFLVSKGITWEIG